MHEEIFLFPTEACCDIPGGNMTTHDIKGPESENDSGFNKAGKAARPSEQTAPEQAISVPGGYIFYHIGCF
ncbi:MAG: hypothetical protein ABSG35_12695 [Syntrophobacteraceae bacterium]